MPMDPACKDQKKQPSISSWTHHFEDSWMIKISRDRALGATVSRATMAGRGGGRRGSGG